ncbi:MAG: glycosyltransferase family 39 protein [Thermodesulfobacteriota bacterium]|nr:glycosyltransferase family 39 protein [Thermodesulfobacteriota bacterium]
MILLLGSCLRFYQLGEKSLWTDELVIISNAVNLVDVKSFFAHTRSDDLPRFYSLLFKYWMFLGNSEYSMRALSVIFGCLSILTTYVVCRLFFDTKTSLLSAFLTAISPFLLIYDREIRMYSLFALFSLLSSYSFIRSLRENRKVFWIFYVVVNVLNIYTHYYAFLVLGVQWLLVTLRFRYYKKILKPWIITNGTIFLFFMIRLSAVIQDIAYHAPWAIPRERFPFIFGKQFVEFFYIFFSLSVGQTILPWNPFAAPIFLVVLVCFISAIKKEAPFSQDTLYLVLLIFIPIIIGILFRISLPRYFIFVAPIFFMLVARGFWLLPKKITMVIGVIVLFGWSYGLANYYQNKEFHIMAHVDPWRDVAQFIKENVTEDPEVVCIGIGVIPIRYYYGNSIPGFSGEALIKKVRELDKIGTKRIWLVYTFQEEYENWLEARDILNNHYNILFEKKWSHDPSYKLKKRLFKRNFAPYRIVAELYERKSIR